MVDILCNNLLPLIFIGQNIFLQTKEEFMNRK